jgi:hypothetical protein
VQLEGDCALLSWGTRQRALVVDGDVRRLLEGGKVGGMQGGVCNVPRSDMRAIVIKLLKMVPCPMRIWFFMGHALLREETGLLRERARPMMCQTVWSFMGHGILVLKPAVNFLRAFEALLLSALT